MADKKKIAIFGAGENGDVGYAKLSLYFNVVYYIDNNEEKWGTRLHGVEVISLAALQSVKDRDDIVIVITILNYSEVLSQLRDNGIISYYIYLEGMLYFTDGYGKRMLPYEPRLVSYYKKSDDRVLDVLYVQQRACIRTHKIAAAMRNLGVRVHLLYTIASPESHNSEFTDNYSGVYTLCTMDGIVDFINNSDFDIVHSSNEPDILTNVVSLSNKKVIYDIHDAMSLRDDPNPSVMALEYLACKKADGILFVGNEFGRLMTDKYHIPDEKTFIMPNYVEDSLKVKENLPKLSEKDGEIHLVYEGGIAGDNRKYHHRYFEEIWLKVAGEGIHIHFYSPSDDAYCRRLEAKSPYLHFEGNMGSQSLVTELTRYDAGIAFWNIDKTKFPFHYIDVTSAVKYHEYLLAGIPICIANGDNAGELKDLGVCVNIDMDAPVRPQIEKIYDIRVPKDFIANNKYTMNTSADRLLKFYKKIIGIEN